MAKILEMLQAVVDKPCSDMAPPFHKWLDGVIRQISTETARIEYIVRKDMTNAAGFIHGGVISAIFDDLMGTLANALGKEKLLVSVNLYVDFLGNAREKETISAVAKVIRNGNRIVNLESELRTADGTLISRAHSNLTTSNVEIGI